MYISVIIPTFDRPAELTTCVDALVAQTLPTDQFEIIIVDDGSCVPVDAAKLLDSCSSFPEGLSLRVIRQENRGPSVARNRGAQEARGKFLAFTDDDCIPAQDWLERIVSGTQRFPDSLLGGETLNGLDRQLYPEAAHLILDIVYEFYNPEPEDAMFLASNNWFLSRELFKSLGGFDEAFHHAGAEDREFCERWRERNRSIVCYPEAQIEHRHELNFPRFFNLYYRYGAGAFIFHKAKSMQDRKTVTRSRHFHRSLPKLMIKHLKLRSGWLLRCQLLALIALWQVANLSGYIHQGILTLNGRTRCSELHEDAA